MEAAESSFFFIVLAVFLIYLHSLDVFLLFAFWLYS